MTQSSDLVAATAAPSAPSKTKRFAQVAGAAALSVGLMGTFAFPAYATPDSSGPGADGLNEQLSATAFSDTDSANVQNLTVSESTANENVAVDALAGTAKTSDDQAQAAEEKVKAAEDQAKQDAQDEAAEALEAQQASASDDAAPADDVAGEDIPSGEGAGAIVNAARAQLGVMQDCTALVEKSLRAAGIPAGDLGTQVGEYTALGGKQISSGSMAPGDILVWPGAHVAVYIGNGQAVHGGWNGGTTAIGPISGGTMGGGPGAVVRF